MEEYIENGARLGWLIDPINKRTYVYQPNAAVDEQLRPKFLDGGAVLRGFTLDLEPIWAEESAA